jgi:hypothetical protein
MQRETVRLPAAILVAVRALRLSLLRRSPGDESRQPGFIAGLRLLLLHAWLLLLLIIALLARLIVVVVALHERLRILRQVRLLARAERLLPEGLAVLVAAFLELLVAALLEVLVVSSRSFRPLRLEVRILLAELLVRRRDQPEIMFSVLEIIFGRDRIAGGLGVTRKLEILLRDVIGCPANLHIRAVRFVNPRQGILIAPVVVLLIIAPAHTLVVMMLLTVSHGLLFNDS